MRHLEGLREESAADTIEAWSGGMAEWLKAAVLKTAFRFPERGFESLSLRHLIMGSDHAL